jgi:hypothetical protein
MVFPDSASPIAPEEANIHRNQKEVWRSQLIGPGIKMKFWKVKGDRDSRGRSPPSAGRWSTILIDYPRNIGVLNHRTGCRPEHDLQCLLKVPTFLSPGF